MDYRIFYPTSSSDFTHVLGCGQRYRHAFGDSRLTKRYEDFLMRLRQKGSCIIHQLSDVRKDIAGIYRFIKNKRVDVAELIYHSSRIPEVCISGKDLQVNLDTTSFSIDHVGLARKRWAEELGVVENNRTAGFYMKASLVLERATQHCVGLGEVLLHTRPKSQLSGKAQRKAHYERRKLPLHHRESGAWAIAASNTATQLQAARRVTFVMDQGGDSYEIFHHILQHIKRDFLVRVKHNRQATLETSGMSGSLEQLLAPQPWSDVRKVEIRKLDHYSKSSNKRVQRKKRQAQLAIRFMPVKLERPEFFAKQLSAIMQPLSLIEVMEMEASVPTGEPPIHWRLLCSWDVQQLQTAWEVVQAYQGRWHIEQLFRCCKKQGLDVESAQLRDPISIMKLAVMSVTVAAQALQLTQARDGEEFVPIQEMFDEQKQELLRNINAKLSGPTQKLTNPHEPDSLAWAAWVIARLGGWKGYASQRKPGPITMMRGLNRFYELCFWTDLDFSP